MKLLPHQTTDAQFLADRKVAGCFNGMGTGKTLTALEATIIAEVLRVLIIGPPISLRMWATEAANWTGAKVQILAKGTTPIDRDPEVEILICSYEIATKRQHELMAWAREPLNGMRTALICDESHALKSHKAKRTKAILGKGGMVEAFEHSWFLTGSPMTRWADDLFPFLCRAAPQEIKKKVGALSIDRFNLRYCIVQEKKWPGAFRPVKTTVGSRNLDELGAILASCATRRTLDDVWEDMPPITYTRLPVEVSGRLTKDFDAMTMAQIERAIAENDEALATKRREMGMEIVPTASDFIRDRAETNTGAVLVGAWHREVIDALTELLHIKKLRVAKLDGRTSAAMKTELQRQFNEGELDVLVGQIGAMGVSLNLQRGGSNIVVVEEDWSPSVMDQFYARLHRMGQGRPVHVDTLYADTKLSKAVHAISQAKRRAHAQTSTAHQEASQ